MIPGAALAEWLSDRDAQRHSYERVDAAAQRWSVQPLMTQLEREVAELEPRTAEDLLAAARRFMDRTAEIDAMMARADRHRAAPIPSSGRPSIRWSARCTTACSSTTIPTCPSRWA